MKKLLAVLIVFWGVSMPLMASASLTTNLVSYWKFDASSGNAADSVASNTLTNTNACTYSAGKINNAVNYTSSLSNSMQISDGSQSGLEPSGDMSINCWIKPSNTNYFAIAGKDSASRSYNWNANPTTGVLHAIYCSTTGCDSSHRTIGDSSGGVSSGVYSMVTVVFTPSATGMDFYINDVHQTTTYTSQTATSIANSTGPFFIGSDPNGAFNDGQVDECAFYNRALAQSDVDGLYNSGAGIQYPFTVATSQGFFMALLGWPF